MDFNRRDFLKGALATGALAAGGAALAGCTPASSGSSSSSNTATVNGRPWEVAPDPITNIANTVEADIVVVGAGIAGLNVSSAAAFNGAKVIVLERTEKYQVRGADNGAVGTKFQKDNGLEIDKAEILKYSAQWNAMQINQNLFKIWVEKSGPIFDDLIALMAENGYKVVKGTGTRGDLADAELFYKQYPTAHSFTFDNIEEASMMLPDGRWANNLLGDVLMQQAESNGAEFVFNTLGQQLAMEGSKVIGVIAEGEDGTYTQYNASKGVVLCTGDISGNEDMLKAWAPIVLRADPVAYMPPGANDGIGHMMAMWAGAAVQHGPAAPMIHAVGGQTLSQMSVGWLMVNREGKRFSNETPNEVSTSNARMVQPGGIAWSLFDGKFRENIAKMMGGADSPKFKQTVPDDVDDIIEREISEGTIIRADSLDELAGKLGITDVDALTATVKRYNELCAGGKDVDFLKDEVWMTSSIESAPFYASTVPAIPLTCQFGLNCNDQMQVCDADDYPIEGLYAGGNTCGNFFADDYPLLTPGISHGRAITLGRVLGEALAKGEKIVV